MIRVGKLYGLKGLLNIWDVSLYMPYLERWMNNYSSSGLGSKILVDRDPNFPRIGLGGVLDWSGLNGSLNPMPIYSQIWYPNITRKKQWR